MKSIIDYSTVEIPDDILKRLESLKPKKISDWSPVQDKILIEYWHKKNGNDLAAVLQKSSSQLKGRVQYLKEQGIFK